MTTDAIGLYLHIPYCLSRCNYCDFCSSKCGGAVPDEYIKALCIEAERYSQHKKIPVSTIYIGGGTPSLLSRRQLEFVISVLDKVFDVSSNSEFTMEANPGTLTLDKLKGYKSLGVNRLSIGLQSIHNNELKILGRIHSFEDFLSSFEAARSVGFDNISVDLMYGIPEQTPKSFKESVEKVCEIMPEHISSYGLIIEEGTPFYNNQNKLNIPTEDVECDMYYSACDMLAKKGYNHYEISNFCLEGRSCEHNLKYWRNEEYLGLGVSAYSYYKGVRFGNCRNISDYILSPVSSCIDREVCDIEAEAFEYAMMRLRLREGVDLLDYKTRFGRDIYRDNQEVIEKYIALGLMKRSNEVISLTERGFYISNTILAEIL